MKQMKKRILSMLLALVTLLTILPTAAFAANSTGTGITPVTDPNLWTTRLTSSPIPTARLRQRASSSIAWIWAIPTATEQLRF